MRVLKRDLREGEIKLRLESMDDVWHLHNLVFPGELVRAVTFR
ncbi:MAG: mRNA surveillance protein pelota, partial [Candidatus Thermoplasmatota archaeon]